MPELPDLIVYLNALRSRIVGRRLQQVQLLSPFVLRSVDPPVDALPGREVVGVRRVGKRIVIEFQPDLFLVLHLMIAGRLRWREPGKTLTVRPRQMLASLEFDGGTLFFTEVASEKRASLRVVVGRSALESLNPGGVEPLESTLGAFTEALRRESHTLKRALTDPRLFSGIGNAYSDEILHAARLSPVRLTRSLSDEECVGLYQATRVTLTEWISRLSAESAAGFPDKVTAFRKGMSVHGRFGEACPVCGTPVQRIVYAASQCNYCPRCQTAGRLLADRALSRLLRSDWPRSIDELDARTDTLKR